jgi:predicted DNA-binding transcriptional regulator AlpA
VKKQRKLLSTPDVLRMTSFARATLARLVGQNKFPPPLQNLGVRRNLWLEEDVLAWINAKAPQAIAKRAGNES